MDEDFGLMQCPQPHRWFDDKGNEQRGVMVWAEGEQHAITRQRLIPTGKRREHPDLVTEYLMARAFTRSKVWVREDRLEPLPFRRD